MEQDKNKGSEHLPLIMYSLTIYFFVLGASHTLGKWALFPINILDFMGVADMAKSAASYAVLVFIFLVIQSITIYLTNKKSFNFMFENSLHVEGFLNKTTAILVPAILTVVLISFLGLILLLLKGSKLLFEYGSISIVIMLAPVTLILIMAYIIIINESIKRSSTWLYYSMALCTLTLAPLINFMVGLVGAVAIINGESFSYIATGVENGSDDIMSRDRYLGYYGDRYFVWNPKDEVIKTLPSSQSLKIKQYRKINW